MIPLLGEIWIWTLLSTLAGIGIGWWIWHNNNADRVSALEGELSMARRSADDASASRTRVQKELSEANTKIMPLMTSNTEYVSEIERLKRELATARSDDASDDSEIARLRGIIATSESELMGFRSQAASQNEKLPLFMSAPRGVPDDLRLIKGIGDKLNSLLTSTGIFHFRQIAGWDSNDIDQVDAKLDIFKGRIQRDDWVAQAKLLAAGKHDEFERIYGKMGENN
jgi:predicted flap endonuclease-1-like 5' DNA nuclease